MSGSQRHQRYGARPYAPEERFAGVAPGPSSAPAFSVVGHEYELFDEPETAAFLEADDNLIPWACDAEALVDRYDGRLLLDALPKSAVGKDRAASRGAGDLSSDDEDLELERYGDLHAAEDRQARQQAAAAAAAQQAAAAEEAAAAVGYTYPASDQHTAAQPSDGPGPASEAAALEPPFVPWFSIPAHVLGSIPATLRAHKIMVATAKFVRESNSGQTEIVLRVKQGSNPRMAFLLPSNAQHPYFRWLVDCPPSEDVSNPPPAVKEEADPPHVEEKPEADSQGALNMLTLATFIQRHGPTFEAKVRKQEQNNPRFAFFLPWHPDHAFYRERLQAICGADMTRQIFEPPAATAPANPPARGPVKAQEASGEPEPSAEERQAQRRRLAKELLAAKQAAAAAEEAKQREVQATAIAHHRKMFLSQV
ncbi:hypothetical protein WJX73_007739 [Symbiochloris irregularis]|uniref:SURP motif domain-containing protein n=1 Tax=Symbiochloris irregularis TaxID=706552 RepID=A0AAW1NVB0_9CHLO